MKKARRPRPIPKPDPVAVLARKLLDTLDQSTVGEAVAATITAIGLLYCSKYPSKAEAMMAGQNFGPAIAEFIDKQWAVSRGG